MNAPQTVPRFSGLWLLTGEQDTPSATDVDPFLGCGVHLTKEDQKRHLGKGNGRTRYPDEFLISGLWGFFLTRTFAKPQQRNVFTAQLIPNLLGGVGVTVKVLSLSHITFLLL